MTDSSLPSAFFTFTVENTTDKPMTYSVGFTMANLYAESTGMHTEIATEKCKGIRLADAHRVPDDLEYGDISIVTDNMDSDVQLYWYRGGWFDNMTTYWNGFNTPGPIASRDYIGERTVLDANLSKEDLALLVSHKEILPGETGVFRFVLAWNHPHMYNYWNPINPKTCNCAKELCQHWVPEGTWKHYYATLFATSVESAVYSMDNFSALRDKTKEFHHALYSSTLPEVALDAVVSNLSTIKSPTCYRLEDGSLYGFEGNHTLLGSCDGTCTHVWSYTYAIPFLFPKLERSMRTLEYTYSMQEHGGMAFRLMLPVGRKPIARRSCVDGQYATVMRVLREFKISGDRDWLADIWAEVKQSIEFAWCPKNPDKWDPDKTGIIWGRQHHTLDVELFGPNAWLSGIYLGGLKAGAELALAMGEEEKALEYIEIFERGKLFLNTKLYNGEYYHQLIDVKNKALLAGYGQNMEDVYFYYWSDEHQSIKYQIDEGCGIDQLLGQWHANLIGIGEIFSQSQAKIALHSIYKNNFKNMRDYFNPCRIYALNDESGLVICTWPKTVKKPDIPLTYAEETMTGFEYQAAIHMIQEGLVEEGLECIDAIRDRYDGEKRNPWSEIECGSNYARSMASYALLLTYSGFSYDMSKNYIGFAPIKEKDIFQAFWSIGSGWGRIHYRPKQVTLYLEKGSIQLKTLSLENMDFTASEVLADGEKIDYILEGTTLIFDNLITVNRQIEIN